MDKEYEATEAEHKQCHQDMLYSLFHLLQSQGLHDAFKTEEELLLSSEYQADTAENEMCVRSRWVIDAMKLAGEIVQQHKICLCESNDGAQFVSGLPHPALVVATAYNSWVIGCGPFLEIGEDGDIDFEVPIFSQGGLNLLAFAQAMTSLTCISIQYHGGGL